MTNVAAFILEQFQFTTVWDQNHSTHISASNWIFLPVHQINCQLNASFLGTKCPYIGKQRDLVKNLSKLWLYIVTFYHWGQQYVRLLYLTSWHNIMNCKKNVKHTKSSNIHAIVNFQPIRSFQLLDTITWPSFSTSCLRLPSSSSSWPY